MRTKEGYEKFKELAEWMDEELEEVMFSDSKKYEHLETGVHLTATEARTFLTEAVERIRKVEAIVRRVEGW